MGLRASLAGSRRSDKQSVFRRACHGYRHLCHLQTKENLSHHGNLSKPGHSLVHRQDLSRPPHHDLSS
ncbi:hypothetical protein C8240_15670, partial [Paracidovorax cattleyae]